MYDFHFFCDVDMIRLSLRMFLYFTSEPMTGVNVTKSFLVPSVLECTHLCCAAETCEAFKHRDISDDINCQVTESEPKYSKTRENDENEKWTVYTIMKVGLVRSSVLNATSSKGFCSFYYTNRFLSVVK